MTWKKCKDCGLPFPPEEATCPWCGGDWTWLPNPIETGSQILYKGPSSDTFSTNHYPNLSSLVCMGTPSFCYKRA